MIFGLIVARNFWLTWLLIVSIESFKCLPPQMNWTELCSRDLKHHYYKKWKNYCVYTNVSQLTFIFSIPPYHATLTAPSSIENPALVRAEINWTLNVSTPTHNQSPGLQHFTLHPSRTEWMFSNQTNTSDSQACVRIYCFTFCYSAVLHIIMPVFISFNLKQ